MNKRLKIMMLISFSMKRLCIYLMTFNAVSARVTTTYPGSNSLCDGKPRIRRDWDLIGSTEKELFKQAVEESIDRGIYQTFRSYHADLMSSIQSHETCAFALWHRRYLLAFENMLRSLDTRFSCLTVPYWNIMEHYRDQLRDLCDSFGSCSRVIFDLGGSPVTFEATRTYSGIEGSGALLTGRPISRLKDDDGNVGIVRDDLLCVELPPSCEYSAIIDIYSTSTSYIDFTRNIQAGIHDDVHDLIGGLMPTFSSPSDPLFMIWHSTMDLFLFIWEICNIENSASRSVFSQTSPASSFDPFYGNATCTFTNRGANLFPELNATSEMYMKSNNTDIRDDPLIGKYFKDVGLTFQDVASIRDLNENEFTYDDLTFQLWNLIGDSGSCPAGQWYTASPTLSPVSIGPTAAPDLDAFGQWIADIRKDLNNLYPDQPARTGAHISFLLCTLGRDRKVPSEEFRRDFLNGDVSDPLCNFLISGYDDDDTSQGGGGGISPIASPPTPSPPRTISIDWIVPMESEEEDIYSDQRVQVGDSVSFVWEGFHNVYIHPTGNCKRDDSVAVAVEGQNATYTFQDSDVGTVVFVCDVGSHCELGQIVKFIVRKKSEHSHDPIMDPTSSPMQTSSPTRNTSSTSRIGSIIWIYTFVPLLVIF